MDKILDFLTDKERVRNIRTATVFLIIAIVVIVYFGVLDNVSLNDFLTFEVASKPILAFLLSWLGIEEYIRRAEEDEKEQNNEYENTKESLNTEIDIARKQIDHTQEYVNDYNEEERKTQNKIKADEKILKLEQRIIDRKIKGKSTKKLEKRINLYKQDGVIDKHYKPILIKDLLKPETIDKSKKEKVGNRRIKYNYKTKYRIKRLLMSPFQFIGFTAIGLNMVFGTPLLDIALFTGALLLMINLSGITLYLSTRYTIKEIIIPMLKWRYEFIHKMNYITNDAVAEINKVTRNKRDEIFEKGD